MVKHEDLSERGFNGLLWPSKSLQSYDYSDMADILTCDAVQWLSCLALALALLCHDFLSNVAPNCFINRFQFSCHGTLNPRKGREESLSTHMIARAKPSNDLG